MNYHFAEFMFNNKPDGCSAKTAKHSKHSAGTVATLLLIALLVTSPILVVSVYAATGEPTLDDIFSNLGFTNVALVNVETFPAGFYETSLLAEFAGYHAKNVLSYYPVETTNYYTIFSGPEGATGSVGGYVSPIVTKTFMANSQFGFSMMAPEYRYFTEHWKNPDYPEIHAQVYANLDVPGMYLIGFENFYGGYSRDYNDMVFSAIRYAIPEILSVTRSPQDPEYDQTVTITAGVAQGTAAITSVVLSYQVDSGSWTDVPMVLDEGVYVADIPAQVYASVVNYKVLVSDAVGYSVGSVVYSYTVGDFVSPTISNVGQNPVSPIPGQSTGVFATVTEPITASGVKNVTLWYTANNGWSSVSMTSNGDVWGASIPGQNAGQSISYYLKAFDNAENGATTSTRGYSVTIPNDAPVANFVAAPLPAYTNDVIEFDASSSYDTDGYVASYFWTFGDDTFDYGVNATHSYVDDGVYPVILTVTDDRGATATKTINVVVNNRRPVADIDVTKTSVDKKEAITFDATGSYDVDGTIVSYSWDLGDGTTATGETVTRSYLDTGSYTVTLTVTDDDGAVDKALVTITVRNQAPVAIFTESEDSVNVDDEISFNGADSYDPDGRIVKYSWNFGDGTTATGSTATHAYGDNGEYTVTLTVTDNEGATNSKTSTITVINMQPVAAFTSAPETANTNIEFSFDASESYDLDGTIVSYMWDFGDGTTATGVSVSHAYTEDGTYTVTLTVTDDDDATATATETKSVPNLPPVASFTDSAEIVSTGDNIQFDGSGSYDNDGTIVSYMWDFGDGTTATGVTTEHAYAENAEHSVTLTVTDDDGATDSFTVTKTVLNRQPVAQLTTNQTTVTINVAVQLDGSESYDNDGTIVSYMWDFGDGTTATGVTTEHTYEESGDYSVTLTVTDNDGDSASEDMLITVDDEAIQLAVLGVFGLGIMVLTLTLLYGLFIRRRNKKKQNES
jgi:PKD repeat protein